MKKIIFFLFIGLFSLNLISCSTIDVAIAPRANIKNKMKKIAVIPFDIKGAGWGDEFADSITHNFFKSGRFEVVERDAIKKVLKEKKLAMSGLADSSKAVEIGRLLGADVIVFGRGSALRFRKKRYSPLVPNLIDTFSLRVVSIENAKILMTIRKSPGRAWTAGYRFSYCIGGLGIFYDKKDVLVSSSKYDSISEQIVDRIIEAVDKIPVKKKK